MAFVGAGVDGDSVGAEYLSVLCCLDYVRIIASAAVAEGGKFVDIDREFCHVAKVRPGWFTRAGKNYVPVYTSSQIR